MSIITYCCPALQLDETCSITSDPSSSSLEDTSGVLVTSHLRIIAAVALFIEGLIGVYVPVLLKSVEGHEW